MRSATVFCSSNNKVGPLYFSDMEILGKGLAELNLRVVYGGAQIGPMKSLADRALDGGVEVVGVIPKELNQPGIAHEGLSELLEVNDFMDRKKLMIEMADFVIVGPGGIGTLDEFTEALNLKQDSSYKGPILILNSCGYWDPFLHFLDEIQQRGMLRKETQELYLAFDRPEQLLQWISQQL